MNSKSRTKPISIRRELPPADRILVIRLGAMGDVVRALPAVKRLREFYPGAHLTWLVEPGAAGVVDAAGIVDEVLVFPRGYLMRATRTGDGLSLLRQLGSFVREYRRRRFELVFDFHGILKSGLLARLSGAPLRYGYARRAGAREFADLFVNRRVRLDDTGMSRFERNDALVAALVSSASVDEEIDPNPRSSRPLLDASPLASARLAARLRVSGREHARGFVLLHPGTSAGARHKRYAPQAWADVAQGLVEHGVEVWVAAGTSGDERNLVDRIVRESGGAARTAPETRSFDDLLALVTRASVFASADTGPLHAASLAGIPVVQLLGPTHPTQNQPWPETASRRVYVPLSCSPCRRGCASAACMAVISPNSVIEEIMSLRAMTGFESRTVRAEPHS